MYTLAIDTSNQVLGVALMKEHEVIGELVTNIAKNHSIRLMPAIDELLKELEVSPEQLEKIIVAKGPGSYTGVRIGLTTAKTLAWALNIPIIGVSSLKSLAYQGYFFNSIICPFFDARRGLIYTGLYEKRKNNLNEILEEQNILMTDWLEIVQKKNQKVLFLSPDIDNFREMIQDCLGNLAIIPDKTFHISKPSHLALAGSNQKADSTHHLTPNYLRLAEAEANWIKSQGE